MLYVFLPIFPCDVIAWVSVASANNQLMELEKYGLSYRDDKERDRIGFHRGGRHRGSVMVQYGDLMWKPLDFPAVRNPCDRDPFCDSSAASHHNKARQDLLLSRANTPGRTTPTAHIRWKPSCESYQDPAKRECNGFQLSILACSMVCGRTHAGLRLGLGGDEKQRWVLQSKMYMQYYCKVWRSRGLR